jgi:hypothetical protein
LKHRTKCRRQISASSQHISGVLLLAACGIAACTIGEVGGLPPEDGDLERDPLANLTRQQRVNPVFDTYIRGGSHASQTYHKAKELMVKRAEASFTREAYFKFSFAGVKCPVDRATFRFYVAAVGDGNAKTARLYKMNSDVLNAASSWKTVNRESCYRRADVRVTGANRWYSADVTDEVNWQIQNTSTKEVVFRVALEPKSGSTAKHWIKINALEASGRRPRMELALGDKNLLQQLVDADPSKLSFRKDHMLQDFSTAGYRRGASLPKVGTDGSKPWVLSVDSYRASSHADDTIAIQRAIDHAIVLAAQTGKRHVVYLPQKGGGGAYKVSVAEAQRYFASPESFWANPAVTTDKAWVDHYHKHNSGSTKLRQVLWIWGGNVVLKGDGVGKTRLVNTQPKGDYCAHDYMNNKSVIGVKPHNGDRDWAKLARKGKSQTDGGGRYLQIIDTRPIPLKESVGRPTREIRVQGTYDASKRTLTHGGNVLREGDWIIARAFATKSFILAHQAASWWRFWGKGGGVDYTQYRAKVTLGQSTYEYHYAVQGVGFYRRIVKIDGDTLTLDVPVRYQLPVSAGACVHKADPMIEEVGIEGLSLSSRPYFKKSGKSYVYQGDAGFKNRSYETKGSPGYCVHGAKLISFNYVRNGWIRSLHTFDSAHGSIFPADGESFHHLSNGISLSSVRGITVQDCKIRNSQYLAEGGNGYSFTLTNASECLIRDSAAANYRHGYSIAKSFSSGNVIHKSSFGAVAAGSYLRNGRELHDFQLGNDYHMWFSQANLIDSVTVTNDLLVATARSASGGPGRQAGRTSIYGVFWNVHGNAYRHPGYWSRCRSKGQASCSGENSPWIVLSDQSQGFGYVIGTSGAGRVARVHTEQYLGTHKVTDLVLFEKKASALPFSSLYAYQKSH